MGQDCSWLAGSPCGGWGATHTEFRCGTEQAIHSFLTISTAELSATSKKEFSYYSPTDLIYCLVYSCLSSPSSLHQFDICIVFPCSFVEHGFSGNSLLGFEWFYPGVFGAH